MAIKKIPVSELRLGMHIHEFCGSWMSHPFWRSKFTLRAEAELLRISSGGHHEVWIDTAKGGDVSASAVQQIQPDKRVQENDFVASMPFELETGEESNEEALARASAIFRRSVPRIAALFGEARLGRAVDARICDDLVDDISDSVMRNPGALINVARLKRRDEYTYMHSVAVCALMVSLGRDMGLKGDELRAAGLAGMLHDLGKAVIPDDVLGKPGKLTDAEFTLIKTHPERGHALLLEGGTAGEQALDVCLHHHEKIDGSGYPHGLRGEQISLFAKMGAVCDVYDALTSVRPYKEGWNPADALRRMAQWSGHFEPFVYQSFVKTVGIYPVGSLVRLHSGKLGVVTSQNAQSLLKPRVKTFFSTKSDLRIEPQEIDLSGPWCQDKIVACESADDWKFKDLDALWGAPVMTGH